MEHNSKVIKTKEVVGVKVINLEKEKLGEISEIVIDKSSGRVAYVVLSTASFLGMSGKFFAIPWHAIKYDIEEKCFILNINKALIDNAIGFDKEFWPEIADRAFVKISEYDTTT